MDLFIHVHLTLAMLRSWSVKVLLVSELLLNFIIIVVVVAVVFNVPTA